MGKIYSFKNEITGKNSWKSIDILKNISSSTKCTLDWEIFSQSGDNTTVKFEVSGEKQDVEKALDKFNFEMAKYNLENFFKRDEVNILVENQSEREYLLRVNVPKFSNFFNLAQAAVVELDIPCEVYTETKGWFQGKDVVVRAVDTENKLNNFRKLLHNFIIDSSPKNKKMRM